MFLPVHDHAGLRECESKECPNCIKRNEPVGNAAECDKHSATQQRQHDDAVGVDQAPATIAKDMRKIIVLRDGATESWKIRERRISGERQNNKDRADGKVVKKSFA